MQELWKKPLGWDDILPEETCREWRLIFMDLEKLNTISFPRCLKPDVPLGEPELHVFADASMCAYGACAYLLWKTDEKPSVRPVSAKVRVGPLRQVTVPQLELMAALVASRLAKTLCSEMRTMPDVTLWSDSRVVLKWLCSESTSKKPFVAVRLAEIQSTWESRRWKYVPSRDNAVDDLRRGVRVSEIPERWFQGPEFLKKTIEEWPEQETVEEIEDHTEDRRKIPKCLGVQLQCEKRMAMVIDCEKYSSWKKLLRVTAYCLRFIERLKMKTSGETCIDSSGNMVLEPSELQSAERYWIGKAQEGIPEST